MLTTLKGQPFKVLFIGSYGGMFKVQNLATTKVEADSFTGQFSAVFDLGAAYNTDPAVIKAMEVQCDNWPVSP